MAEKTREMILAEAKANAKKNHVKTGSAIADVVIYVMLAVLSVIFLYPLYQVAVCSISSPQSVMANNSLMLLPEGIQFDAYKIVFQNKNIWIGFKNTLLYLVLGTGLTYFLTVITAYPMSIKGLAGRRVFLLYFTITMYFGGGMIPTFLLINKLGWMNSIWALIVPGAVNVWDMVIMRTQFSTMPTELKEAAIVDGAGDITILFRILLPLSGAVSAVIILFSAVSYWNMWFPPMIYLTKRTMYPIQSILREILIDEASVSSAGSAGGAQKMMSHNFDQAAVKQLIKYANIVVTTVPILCVYPFAQKYFVKGVMVGSLKG